MKLFKIFSSTIIAACICSSTIETNAKDLFASPDSIYKDVCSGLKYNYNKPVAIKVIGKRKIYKKQVSHCLGTFKITYYWPGEDKWGHKTKTGARSKHLRTIAVDPNIIPLKKEVIVKFPDGSYKTMIAVDTGKAVKGKVIDVFTEHPIRKRFYTKVYIKKKG